MVKVKREKEGGGKMGVERNTSAAESRATMRASPSGHVTPRYVASDVNKGVMSRKGRRTGRTGRLPNREVATWPWTAPSVDVSSSFCLFPRRSVSFYNVLYLSTGPYAQ